MLMTLLVGFQVSLCRDRSRCLRLLILSVFLQIHFTDLMASPTIGPKGSFWYFAESHFPWNDAYAIDTVYNEYPQNFGGTTWGVGDFQWNIPREWRIGTGSATQYTSLLHHFLSDAVGKATISKVEPDRFLKMQTTPRPIFSRRIKEMHTRNTKPVWIASMLTLLIGGYPVLGSIVHPDQTRSIRAVSSGPSPNSADATKTMPGKPTHLEEGNQGERYNEMLLRIKAARQSREVSELARLGEEIEITWSNLNPTSYASLMLEVCNALSSTDLKDDTQYVLEQKYASLVLSKQLEIPVVTEAKLVLHLQDDIEYIKGQVSTAEWAQQRRAKADIWLRTWQRLNAAIDPNFDFKDLPLMNVPLPPGVSGPAGMSPLHIKDPAIRERYQQAIDENDKKATAYRVQLALYQERETYGKALEAYLVRAYSRPPESRHELETILKAHLVEDRLSSSILGKMSRK